MCAGDDIKTPNTASLYLPDNLEELVLRLNGYCH